MALDADLGVDSIKRVEILSALQEKLPHAPVVKPEHLGTLHTLTDVAAFLSGGAVGDATPPVPLPLPPESPTLTAAAVLSETLPPAPSDIADTLLAVVAEKTGYPVAMLSLDMALDADLGVDSIKRVEILSALQEKLPHAPVVKPEHLGTLHTLTDVAAFLSGHASGSITAHLSPSELVAPKTEQIETVRMAAVSESTLTAPPKPVNGTPTLPPADGIDRSILQVVDIELRSPRPKVVLADGAEVWVVGAADEPVVKELTAELSARRLAVKTWGWVDPAVANPVGNPSVLLLVAPAKGGVQHLNRLAVRWLQQAGPQVRQAAKNAAGVVATVSQLDGGFGLVDLPPTADPAAGGLAGLAKTVRHEWPEVSAKAIDLNPAFALSGPRKAAAAVADELFTVGPAEVGVSATHRVGVELARTVRKPGGVPAPLGAKDVVLVTGGGRGVTAEVSAALAEGFGCSLVLVGRTTLPATEPAWASGAVDEAGLKASAAAHLGAAATPKAAGDLAAAVLAQREVRHTLARIEAAGARAKYEAADVADPEQLADLLDRVQGRFGPITGLVHGAGVLADKRIEDLTADAFDRVYRTKVDGLRNLLDLLGGQPLKAMILFSSTTARLGRTGQLAYAVANEVLNKTAQAESKKRPACRVVSINWGPWDGGMVTPGLKKVFEGEGVGLIPPADGGRFAVQELLTPGRSVEVVALAGAKAKSTGVPAATANRVPPAGGSGVVTAPAPAADLAPVFERTVSVGTHPVLRSHVLNGKAVLPFAVHLEWLAHAALHGNPGLVFHGFDQARVLNGLKVGEEAGAVVRALAGRAQKRDSGQFAVPVELRAPLRDGKETVFSRGEVILAPALPPAPPADPRPPLGEYPHPTDELYQHFLFHGPDLHALQGVSGLSESAVAGTAFPAPAPAEWMAAPVRGRWLLDPLVIDAAFQLMILWSFAQHGAGSLPSFAGRYRQYRRAFPAGPCGVVARVTRDNGTYARADIDLIDPADGGLVARFQDYECQIDAALNQAFRRNQLPGRVAV